MGLDMFAHRVKKKLNDVPPFFEDEEAPRYVLNEDPEEFEYWRKHPNLHGWFKNLYHKKGGKGDFNCIWVEVTLGDLEQLEKDILHGWLPYTEGFFFGKSDNTEQQKEFDLNFVRKAKDEIAQGYSIYYEGWW